MLVSSLSDLYIKDAPSKLETLPYFSINLDLRKFDPIEFCMGMRRGGLLCPYFREPNALQVQEHLINMFGDSKWALVPDEKILQILKDLCVHNMQFSTYVRKCWEDIEELQADSYTYTLYYDSDQFLIHTRPNGALCESGSTELELDLHPCLTLHAAVRFFYTLRENPGELSRIPQNPRLLALGCVGAMQQTIPLSFVAQNRVVDEVRPRPECWDDVNLVPVC